MTFLWGLLSTPFRCLFPEEESDLSTSQDFSDIAMVGILVQEEAVESWPPRKHRSPFVGKMASYWYVRISREMAVKQVFLHRTQRVFFRGSIEV